MKNSVVVFIFIVLLTVALAVVPRIRQQDVDSIAPGLQKEFFQFVLNNRLRIISLAAISHVILSSFYSFLISPKKEKAKIRASIMQVMCEDLFNDEKNVLRITIFKDAGRFKRVYYSVIRLKRWTWLKIQRKTAKYPLRGDYIYVFQRLGTEHQKSKTFFYVSRDTEQDCEGIAARTRQKQSAISISNLPDIRNVEIDEIDLSSRRRDVVRAVTDYLQQTFITVEILKQINVRARHFHGEVIYDSKGEPVGVLMIDSWQEESPFADNIKPSVQRYVKLLGQTM